MTTTPQAQVKHVLPTQGTTYRARGFLCTFKLLASDTNGAFTLSEASNAPNTGVPPHIQHLEDEAFIVLEGTYTFQVGDQTCSAGPAKCSTSRAACRMRSPIPAASRHAC